MKDIFMTIFGIGILAVYVLALTSIFVIRSRAGKILKELRELRQIVVGRP